MHDVLHLAIAVRNKYRKSDDFTKIESYLETLYVSGHCSFPLKAYSSSVIEQALKGLKFVRTFEMRLKTNLTAGMTSCFSLRWLSLAVLSY